MGRNAVSSKEALDLLAKLLAEETPVCASLFASSGLRARLRGFVNSITELNGVVVSSEAPPSIGTNWLSVPLSGREAVCLYGDKREFGDAGATFAQEYGDTMLSFRFADSSDLLVLTFNL
jgi:hypothetical protein